MSLKQDFELGLLRNVRTVEIFEDSSRYTTEPHLHYEVAMRLDFKYEVSPNRLLYQMFGLQLVMLRNDCIIALN